MMMNPQMGLQQMSEPHQLQDIQLPGVNDVMCGRGGGTNNHIGNIRFRQLVNGHKLRYLAATKSEKPMVSKEVVTIWRGLQPPGRFLMQEKTKGDTGTATTGKWYDIGDKKAREKASQCLRERTPEVIPFVKKLDLQLQYQQEAESGSNEESRRNAEELSNELLQEQQQAAITAHQALNAYLPMSIMKMSQKVNAMNHLPSQTPPMMQQPHYGNDMSQHTMQQLHPALMTSANIPGPTIHNNSTNNSRPQSSSASSKKQTMSRRQSAQDLKDQIQREIEELQQAQAKLEAEAKAAEKEVAKATGTGNFSSHDILNACDLGGIGGFIPFDHSSDPIAPSTQLTKEEYRQSVKEFLGTSSGQSSSGLLSTGSANEKAPKRGRPTRMGSFDRFDRMNSMSHESWVQTFDTLDDASMTSNPLSPGNSMHKMLSHDLEHLEPLDIRHGILAENTKTSDKSLGKASLSTYESQILENLISPANIDAFERLHGLPNIKEDESRMPSPRMDMAPPPNVSHAAMHAHSHSNSHQNSSQSHNTQSHNTQSHNAQSRFSNSTNVQQSRFSNSTSPYHDYFNGHASHNYTSTATASRPHLAPQKGVSATSMLSDLSDFSNKTAAAMISKQRFDSMPKTKVDPSMFADNMSDLSNAMDSLDVSTNKSYKE